MAKLFKVNGSEVNVHPANGSDFELEEMKQLVGGYIELITLPDKYLVVNEDGIDMGLLFNCKASERFGIDLYGDVLVVDKKEVR